MSLIITYFTENPDISDEDIIKKLDSNSEDYIDNLEKLVEIIQKNIKIKLWEQFIENPKSFENNGYFPVKSHFTFDGMLNRILSNMTQKYNNELQNKINDYNDRKIMKSLNERKKYEEEFNKIKYKDKKFNCIITYFDNPEVNRCKNTSITITSLKDNGMNSKFYLDDLRELLKIIRENYAYFCKIENKEIKEQEVKLYMRKYYEEFDKEKEKFEIYFSNKQKNEAIKDQNWFWNQHFQNINQYK